MFKTLILTFIFYGLTACGGGSTEEVQEHKSGRLVDNELVAEYSAKSITIQGLDAKYAVDVYRVVYETKDVEGNYIDASGIVSVPVKISSSKSPTILYHHGTIYQNSRAPSEAYQKGASWVLPSYLGFITVAPDYIGYGESLGTLHPYLNAKVTASSSVDLLISAQELLKKLGVFTNDQLFLGGYSQGGGATLASQRLLEAEYKDKFSVTASSAGAGAYALSQELLDDAQEIVDNYDNFYITRPSNMGLILKAMDNAYQLNSLNDFFKAKYADVVNTIYDGKHSSVEIDNSLTHKASELIKKDYLVKLLNGQKQPLINAFKDNDLFDWTPKAPTQLFHGRDDDWVRFSHAQTAYDQMLANGATNIQLVECSVANKQPANHANCFLPYLFSSYQFFLKYATNL